jgi:hypothetical protein
VNDVTLAKRPPGVELVVPTTFGDDTMQIAPTKFITAQREVKSNDMTIILGYAAVALMLLIAIYLASLSSGAELGDFATMTVFP